MGIPGLWKILEPTKDDTSLLELSVQEGFKANRHGTGTIVVGVDASPMFYAAQAIFAKPGYSHAQAGQNPELRTLFYRLAWLSRSGVSAVFVFDGPNRPEKKRNRTVRTAPHWMIKKFQELVEGFGFHCYTAPGEAEAELAFLNSVQAIDVVLTSDSDIFLFGATQVIRSPLDSHHLDDITVFTTERFKAHSSELFTVPGFLFLAVVNGGDYDKAGLPHCGSRIASALASSPLAKSLYEAGKTLSGKKLKTFLESWRQDLQRELTNDPNGLLGRKYPSIAQGMPLNFPDPVALKQYCCPITSTRLPSESQTWFNPRVPDTPKLASLCSGLFDWGPIIVDKMISHVWDGYFIRKLIESRYLGSGSIPTGPPNLNGPTFRCVHKFDKKVKSVSGFHSYQITAWIPSLVAEAATAVLDTSGMSSTVVQGLSSTNSMLVWIPEPILRVTNNNQVADYHTRHPANPALSQPGGYSPVLESDFEILVNMPA